MLQLKPHQTEGVAFLKTTRCRALVASDMGTGKTAMSICYIKEIRAFPVLIVCPASLKDNWAKELRDWAGVESAIVQGETPYAIEGKPLVVIINYDILDKHVITLAATPFKAVIFDECDTLSNPKSKRTKAAKALSRRIPGVIGMSGTPIRNRPADFWPILNIIRPTEFPSFNNYGWQYCEPKRNYFSGKWEFRGAANLDKLYASIQHFTLRHTEEILNLPKRHNHVQLLRCNLDEYRLAETDFTNWLGKAKPESLKKAAKSQAIMKIGALLGLAAKAKTPATIQWARSILQDESQKLVIFCNHLKMQEAIARYTLPEHTVMINGNVPTTKRQAIVERFQDDPSCRLMVAGIKAAGVGLTLTAATKLIMAELPWTSAAAMQAVKRIHRIGQEEETHILWGVAAGTIDEKLFYLIQEKQNISDGAIDGMSPSSALTDLLLSSMQKAGKLCSKK